MDYPFLVDLFDRSPSIRLLQSDSAPFVVYFLYRHFKQGGHQPAISVESFLFQMDNELAQYQDGNKPLKGEPADYLRDWIKKGYLREFINDQDNVRMVELTSAVERVFNWLEDLRERQFVGTESRLVRIFSLLETIAVRSTDDPSQLLAQLEQERREIVERINRIRATNQNERLTETQVREQFLEAENTARSMISDFREVEQKFREIADGIYTAQLIPDVQRGRVLSNALDADDELHQSDQGRSFYAFWDFLNAPERPARFRALYDQVSVLPELYGFIRVDSTLRRFIPNLLNAARRVREQNSALLERLRRLLDNQTLEENKRLRTLIDSFKRELIEGHDGQLPQRQFWEIDGEPELTLPLDRPLWSSQHRVSISRRELSKGTVTGDAVAEELSSVFFVNKDRLRKNIEELVAEYDTVSLQDVLDFHPVKQGLAEMVAYYEIANEDERHSIVYDTYDTFYVARNGDDQEVEVSGPRIIFRSM